MVDNEHNRVNFQLFELNNNGKHAFNRLIKYLELPIDVIPPLDESCYLVLGCNYQLISLIFA
jgi:hypothetical protein